MPRHVKNFGIVQLLWENAHIYVDDHDVCPMPAVPEQLAIRFLLYVYDVMPIYLMDFDEKRPEPYGSILIRHSLGRRFLPYVDCTLPMYNCWTTLLPLSLPYGSTDCLSWTIKQLSIHHLYQLPGVGVPPNHFRSNDQPLGEESVRFEIPEEEAFPFGVTPHGPFHAIAYPRQAPLRPISCHLAIQLEVVYLQRAAKVSHEIDMFNALKKSRGTVDRFVPVEALEEALRGFIDRDFSLQYANTPFEPQYSLLDEIADIPERILINFPVILKHFMKQGHPLTAGRYYSNEEHEVPVTPSSSPVVLQDAPSVEGEEVEG